MGRECLLGVAVGAVMNAASAIAINFESVMTLSAARVQVDEFQAGVKDDPSARLFFPEPSSNFVVDAPIKGIWVISVLESREYASHLSLDRTYF